MTTYLVTGAGGDLGAVTARELAATGARVVLAVRVTPPPGDTEVRRLDVLVNNAGVMAVPYAKTADGLRDAHGRQPLRPVPAAEPAAAAPHRPGSTT